jgi:hypothetical protein
LDIAVDIAVDCTYHAERAAAAGGQPGEREIHDDGASSAQALATSGKRW